MSTWRQVLYVQVQVQQVLTPQVRVRVPSTTFLQFRHFISGKPTLYR